MHPHSLSVRGAETCDSFTTQLSQEKITRQRSLHLSNHFSRSHLLCYPCSVFCPLRSLQTSWGPGMPSTYYLLPGKEYNLCMQDTSDATSKRCSLVSQHQRTSTPTGRDLSRGSTVRSVPIWDSSDAEKNPCLVSDESSKTMSSIQALANTRLE